MISGDELTKFIRHRPNAKFQCNVFAQSKLDDPTKFEDTPEGEASRFNDTNLCPFILKYKRRDPEDKCSNYILEAFNPVHNHELRFNRHLMAEQPV